MKILFVIGSMSGGGAERVVSVLSNQFVDSGHQVIITPIANPKCDYDLDNKIKVNFIDAKKSIRGLRGLKRIWLLRKYINTEKPDIVISFTAGVNIYTIFATLFSRQKIIISERNNPYTDPVKKSTRILRDFLYRFSQGFVFQTEDAKNYFSKSIQKRSIIIPNPIKSNLPEPFTGVRKKEIVTVTRLEPQKNLSLLIKAFKKFSNEHPDYLLNIYGQGSLRQKLNKLIEDENLSKKAFLHGFSKEVHSKIRMAAMFVLSSDYEGISNAMLEALAIGIPTISTDHPIGGARMFINNSENGLLVPVGDVESMYMAMKRIAEDEHFSSKLSGNSVNVRMQLDKDVILTKWLDYINILIKD